MTSGPKSQQERLRAISPRCEVSSFVCHEFDPNISGVGALVCVDGIWEVRLRSVHPVASVSTRWRSETRAVLILAVNCESMGGLLEDAFERDEYVLQIWYGAPRTCIELHT